jgi:hypothetical protein
MKINVRNSSLNTSCLELIGCFKKYGVVTDAGVSKYTVGGQFRALGFMEMPFHVQGQTTIDGLLHKKLSGNQLTISGEGI